MQDRLKGVVGVQEAMELAEDNAGIRDPCSSTSMSAAHIPARAFVLARGYQEKGPLANEGFEY